MHQKAFGGRAPPGPAGGAEVEVEVGPILQLGVWGPDPLATIWGLLRKRWKGGEEGLRRGGERGKWEEKGEKG